MITPQFVCRFGALLALVATTLAAQANITDWNNLTVLTTGTQIQITADSRTIRGKVDRITDDVVVVISRNGQERLNNLKREYVVSPSKMCEADFPLYPKDDSFATNQPR